MESKSKKNQTIFNLFLIALTLSLGLLINTSDAQTVSFDENIILEEYNGGTMIVDVLYANNKLFVYSSKELLVYSNDGSSLLQTFELTPFGKFAPYFFNDALWVPDTKLMAYNPTYNILYIVTADLKIKAFGFDNGSVIPLGIKVETPGIILDMNILHGYSIIKYDKEHQRLFWIVDGRSANDNLNGEFHVRETYFAIHKVTNSGEDFDLLHSEFHIHNFEDYFSSILDVEFIDNNNHYYLARKQKVEIFNIDEDPPQGQPVVTLVKTHEMQEGKIGKLLYVKDVGFHKVIAFPYRLPFQNGVFEPDSSSYRVKFYVIDVVNYLDDAVAVDAPDRRMYDAVYLSDHDDLIICRNPVNDPFVPEIINQDITIYHWNGSTFALSENNIINTNGFVNNVVPNTPIRMIAAGNDGVIISKKHEIVYLYRNSGDVYVFEQKYEGENNIFFFSAQGNNQTFIINLVNNGIERLDASFDPDNTIRTAYPAFHIVHNGPYDRLFFYHTLGSYNSGLYLHNVQSGSTVNINNQNSENKVDKPIGDCIYNHYKNQILVSENAPSVNGDGLIKCYNATSGSYEESITIPGSGYCKEMFIAPNGFLYIAANMKYDNMFNPKIYILDAYTYAEVNGSSGEVINIPIPIITF